MPRNLTFSVENLEAILDGALEHAAHGWMYFEKEMRVNRLNPDSWPPQVEAPVQSAQYHFASVIEHLQRAYEIIRNEQDHTEKIMEQVNKALGK
jgi:hypothetical protein